MVQQAVGKTLSGAWEEFEFDGYGRRFFVKNFTEDNIHVTFDVDNSSVYTVKSGAAEEIATSYSPVVSPSFYKKSIWVNGEGYVEVEQIDTSAPSVITNALTITAANVTASSIVLNGSAVEAVPSTLKVGDKLVITYAADTHYSLPTTVAVEGATYTWEGGVLTITKANGTVSVDIEGVADEYDVTYSLTCVTGTNPATITYGEEKELTFAYESGYGSISVSASNGTVTGEGLTKVLSGVTADTTVTATASKIEYDVSITAEHATYTVKVDGETVADVPSKLWVNSVLEITYTAASGYALPETVEVENATSTWAEGVLTISAPTGAVSATITAVVVQ